MRKRPSLMGIPGMSLRGFILIAALGLTPPFLSVAASPRAPEAGMDIQILGQPCAVETPASEKGDERLEHEIKARLEKDPWVLSYKVHAEAKDGNVTLYGMVDNLLARKRAALLARTIPGVETVDNQIKVILPQRRDQNIQAEISAFFLHEPPLQNYKGTIQIKHGHAILSGYVDTPYQRQLAQWVAESVPGVRWVENKLLVNHLVKPSEKQIQENIASRIKWDPWLKNPDVVVRVSKGSVELAGTVDSATAWKHAVEDARRSGIASVNTSGLRVAGIEAAGGSERG